MSQTKLSVKDHKHTYTYEIKRMTMYQQSKIIELTDEQNETFYMFYYKNKYLNIVKAKPFKPDSHIANAYQHGITFPSPHPFIDATLAASDVYKKHRFNDLFPRLQKQFSNQETTVIATFFESFIKKEQLVRFIKTLFYDDRRSGKMFACYRMYRILETFAPTHSWVRSLAGELEFKKFSPLYEKLDPSLWDKDPFFMENTLWQELSDENKYNQLIAFLQRQGRWLEELAVCIKRVEIEPAGSSYPLLTDKLRVHFSGDAYTTVLEDLYSRIPASPPLQSDLLEQYLSQDAPEKALKLIATHDLTLEEKQLQQFNTIVDHIDLASGSLSLEELNHVIASLFTVIPNQARTLLEKAIRILMTDHDLSYIKDWLDPLATIPEAQEVVQQIERMQAFQDDPNHQLQLGELYYTFNQLNQAIECFSFEMELNEHNPKPVQWLSKLYNELGMKQEAKAYQKLYVDMVENAQ
ncbi:hypothetical protein ACFFGV_12205 [Pontibacillus salicampi]|uniref:Tetratricopeptide repeat protein n=1 Tax=Pontibacillus salicampi TaxID=1449801 RepID=A0ABV6LPJ0_9BACI